MQWIRSLLSTFWNRQAVHRQGSAPEDSKRSKHEFTQTDVRQYTPCGTPPPTSFSFLQASSGDGTAPFCTPELGQQRLVLEDGKTVGIANTVRRYAETRPVTLHHTPFEKRVEEELAVEGLVVAQASGLPSGR
ncbi:hypothetical protein V8C86DRAFT_1808355 [Haematococcus lacustris]